MGGLRGKETEREEEIKMDVKNGEKRSLSAAFEEPFVGNCSLLDSVAFVFINRHKIFFI